MRAVGIAIVAGVALAVAGCTPDQDVVPDAPAPGSAVSSLPVIEANEAGPGPRPLLTWPAVESAAEYHVTVFAADGSAYWSWSGAETETHVGGVANPDGAGAFVFENMTWVVMAESADGDVLGISKPGTLAP